MLEKLSHEKWVMSLHSCSKGLLADNQSPILHQCFGNKIVSYPNILQQSRYCLIAHELRYGTYQLLDAMMSVSQSSAYTYTFIVCSCIHGPYTYKA